MLGGILLRFLVGVAVGATAAGTAYVVYKILTKEQIKKDVIEKIGNQISEEEYKKGFIDIGLEAKIKEKFEKGAYKINDFEKNAVRLDVRDKNKNIVFSDIIIEGDEFGDDIRVGSVIKLYD